MGETYNALCYLCYLLHQDQWQALWPHYPHERLATGRPDIPFSFLFLFCAEGLSALLTQATMNGVIQGVDVCPQGPWILHLFLQMIA